jgi:hypothetical protein
MRYINMRDLELPKDWTGKAADLSKKLNDAADDKERSVIMEKNQIWQELLVPLSKLSTNKCWYSEAREIMSDRNVDHFRPKNEARNLDDSLRDGYWWIAYDWDNYRFCSIYSNQKRYDKFEEGKPVGGKSSYFPLFPGSHIAKNKAKIKDEDIYLLDPTDKDDPDLLTFDKNGDALPNSSNPKEIQRVKVSIRLYHLDHTPLKEERQKVWDKCQRLINEIEQIKTEEEMGVVDNARIKFLKEEIRKLINEREELSSVGIACLEHNKYARMLRA